MHAALNILHSCSKFESLHDNDSQGPAHVDAAPRKATSMDFPRCLFDQQFLHYDAVAMIMALCHFVGKDGKGPLYQVTSTISLTNPS
jgi:hypothetical protein